MMASFGEAKDIRFLLEATGPAAADTPITEVIQDSEWRSALILIAVMNVAVIMAWIMLVGSLRKRTSSGAIKWTLWVTVMATPMLISYAVGRMTSTIYDGRFLQYELLPIWGILLLAWLGSYGTISAFQLEDNETALVAYIQGILKCGFVFFMILINALSVPTNLLWVLLVLTPFMFPRVSKRAKAMAYASKNNLFVGVGNRVEIVADFMEWDVQKTNEAEEAAADPKNMDGYRYLVGIKNLLKKKEYKRSPPCYRRDFESEKEHVVTTQEIWQCKGKLLSGGDPDGQLKDTCLSFALFWMLLRRYTGHPLPEVTSQEGKTWKFVQDGLIQDISKETSERTFRVIEQELGFLYDYFYTKNFVTYLYGFGSIIFQFSVMAVYLVVAQIILKIHRNTVDVVVSDHLPPIKLDVFITKIVILVMIGLELALIVHYIFITPWSRVGWVCTYVRKWQSKSWKDICQRWAIEIICRFSLGGNLKRWKREIDQYSLLLNHNYVSRTRFFNCCLRMIPIRFFDVSKKGRKTSNAIPFSTDLKIALLSSLHTNGRRLTKGTSSLAKHKIEPEFSWACNLETYTQTIMVWHIATKYCKLNHQNQNPDNSKKSDYLSLATSLSQYCAYLVAFKPELLPETPGYDIAFEAFSIEDIRVKSAGTVYFVNLLQMYSQSIIINLKLSYYDVHLKRCRDVCVKSSPYY